MNKLLSKTDSIRKALCEEGLSVGAVADKLSVSKVYVYQLASANTWPLNRPITPNSSRANSIARLALAGCPSGVIASRLRLAPSVVERFLESLKAPSNPVLSK